MLVTLRITDTPPGQKMTGSRTLRQGERLRMGRSPDNDWVLPDPDRVVSNQHCVIEWIGDGFVLTDLSTNGTFFGTTETPLGRNNTQKLLTSGDLVVGPYRFKVDVRRGPTKPSRDVAPSLPQESEPVSGPGISDILGGQGLSAMLDDRPAAALDNRMGAWLDDVPNTGENGRDTDFEALGWEAPPTSSILPSQATLPSELGHDSDLAHRSEHVAAIDTIMKVPGGNAVLPADWLEPSPEPIIEDTPPQPSSPSLEASEPPRPTKKRASRVATGETNKPRSETEERLIQAFLEGARLSPTLLEGKNVDVALHELGRLVRIVVDGVRQILQTRALLKNELGLERTVVHSVGNNVLKFSSDTEQALASLIGPPPPGFLSGPEAMLESLTEIKDHEMALFRALGHAAYEITAKIDPKTISDAARSRWNDLPIPALRKANCWDTYVDAFDALRSGTPDPERGAFLSAFAEAYVREAEGR